MTSLKPDDIVFIPFWIVMDFYDSSPPEPFIKAKIKSLYTKTMQSPNGVVQTQVCDLNMGKDHLVAYSIPTDYLIAPESLVEWADKISAWFKNYPSTLG